MPAADLVPGRVDLVSGVDMQRLSIDSRPGWKDTARKYGFNFFNMYGNPYWDETHCYEFTLEQIERDIEAPTEELHQMCLHVVDKVCEDQRWLEALCIPETHWDYVAESWRRKETSLYGRFDLRYDGQSPAKLYEYNADTPTSLYESAFFQWIWLEEASALGIIPKHADQFNSIQEKLITYLSLFSPLEPMFFSCVKGTEEDRGTVSYLQDCAKQAGLLTQFIYIDDIGADTNGQLCDLNGQPIRHLFKLYPWEWAFQEQFGALIPGCDTHFYEPAWKSILSNKGLLALLWHFFEGHKNLLPCFFEGDPQIASLNGSYAKKPLFSREGSNIELLLRDQTIESVPGPYGDEKSVIQALAEPPTFDGCYTVVGSWVIGNSACGIGIREDATRVTRDLSRFIPHYIL